jgi:hypothetical protein
MASAGVSGTVTVGDQRSYITIETLRGKNLTEIHIALHEVCGEETVGCSTVSRWATRFHEVHVIISNDPRPGRLKTSTEERSVKLVVDFLAEDHRPTCEEISQGTTHCLTVDQKEKCMEIATLLKQRFNIEGQAFCIELLLLMKCGLEALNQSRNGKWRSPNSCDPKNFDEHNQRSSK